MEQRVERRLSAVLSADVAGYSRLVGIDEEGTLAQLRSIRLELIDPAIAVHRGRIIKTTGDGILVEFSSVVDAVRCALAVQRSMAERNAEITADRLIALRIGIHLGDVVVDGADLLGDGVNIAARLEGIADPGGISLSEDVWRQVPDKPSIAVLAFQNMSGDPEQEYFTDGMVEDIITGLSRINWLFVIARNSSFAYKGKVIGLKQVGRELGVRYLMEGSVRKATDRVRITGQLIDTATGAHIWGERYDRRSDDIFALQDEITLSVVGAIEPSLRVAEIERVKRKRPDSLDAYDLVLQTQPDVYSGMPARVTRALPLLDKAIEFDPTYALAHAFAAMCH